MRRAWLTLLLLGGAGCDTGFETKSIVLDLRVLGMRTEPAEVVVDDFDPGSPQDVEIPEVTVRALVADPGPNRRVQWEMVACAPTDSLRCDEPDALFVPIAFGTAEDPESEAGADISGSFLVTPQLLEEAVRLDDLAGFGGIGVQIELLVWPEGGDPKTQGAYASKKVIYAPRFPESRRANENPSMAGLGVGPAEPMAEPTGEIPPGRCVEPQTEPYVVAPGERLRLHPLEPDGVREEYVLPTFQGDVLELTENMRYSWFATAGSFRVEQSGGPTDFFGNVPPLHTDWTAPDSPGLYPLWIVQRDDRGGQSWTERCLEVR